MSWKLYGERSATSVFRADQSCFPYTPSFIDRTGQNFGCVTLNFPANAECPRNPHLPQEPLHQAFFFAPATTNYGGHMEG